MHSNYIESHGKIIAAKACEGVCERIKQVNKKKQSKSCKRGDFQTWETELGTAESMQLVTCSELCGF